MRFTTSAKSAAKRTAGWFTKTKVGGKALHHIIAANPEAATEAVFSDLSRRAGFQQIDNWPLAVDSFEDLAFLFSSSHLNIGTAVLAFDEAAHLYRLARKMDASTLVEIGRYKGGSTFLLAAAMPQSSILHSYDWHDAPGQVLQKSSGARRNPARSGTDLDDDLLASLRRYGLDERVHLYNVDSHTAPPPSDNCALIFVDGDHSFDGVAADFANWAPHAQVGAHMLFHDAYPRPFAPSAPGVQRFIGQLESDYEEWLDGPTRVGSLADFTIKQRIPGRAG